MEKRDEMNYIKRREKSYLCVLNCFRTQNHKTKDLNANRSVFGLYKNEIVLNNENNNNFVILLFAFRKTIISDYPT